MGPRPDPKAPRVVWGPSLREAVAGIDWKGRGEGGGGEWGVWRESVCGEWGMGNVGRGGVEGGGYGEGGCLTTPADEAGESG